MNNTQYNFKSTQSQGLIGESLFVTLFSFGLTLLFVFMTFQGGR